MLEKFLYYQELLKRKASRKLKVLNTIELSKSALKHNYNFFKKLHPESKICPVLKSNAYGHGLEEIAQIVDKFSAPYIIVDSFYEAFELQKVGIKTPILIIGYTHPQNFKYMKFKNVAVTVADKETIEELGKLKRKVTIHLEVDTGMHRQGVRMDQVKEALKLTQKYKKLKLEGMWTHLADADNPKNNAFNKEQIQKFKKALAIAEKLGVKPKWKHISASAGASKVFSKDFNMIRLGISLYGAPPLEKIDPYYKKNKFENLKPVLSLSSTLIDIKDLKKGDCVSYKCIFHAPKDMKIGVIPAGYYEGIDRRLSSSGFVYYKGQPCKIVGIVCMNLTMIDLSHIKNPKKFDKITVIGTDIEKKNTAQWMAETIKSIPYVILTNIAPTIRRIIK